MSENKNSQEVRENRVKELMTNLPPSPPASPLLNSRSTPAIKNYNSQDSDTEKNIDDLINLNVLDDNSICNHLAERLMRDIIYTYSGLFLIAVNPWKDLDLYSLEKIRDYRGKRRAEMPPHIFAVCDEAYRSLIDTRRNQTILITGESGAGKTVTTTNVIRYFAKTAVIHQNHRLDEKLLHANPILEAFGNAQTVKNNNSSRFGKFIKISFDQTGIMNGAKIDHYLLEKGRVTNHDCNERSFHIFYYLIKGASSEMRKELCLKNIDEYQYLAGVKSLAGIDDAARFLEICQALKIMGIPQAIIDEIWKVLSVILLLGNLKFEYGTDEASTRITSQLVLSDLSSMIGLGTSQLENAIVSLQLNVNGELIRVNQSPEKAKLAVDALAKDLYDRLFSWIVRQINQHLGAADHQFQQTIGILDIAGFEIFEKNSIEQLFVNFTNEKLQQFFNHHMFIAEQETYIKEGLEWDNINFGLDLQPTIDVIERTMSILDEESIFPRSTDDTFTEKLRNQLTSSGAIFKEIRFENRLFSLKHYAGVVEYQTDGWLAKNKDPLEDTLVSTLSQSTCILISQLFKMDAGLKIRKKGSQFVTQSQHHRKQLTNLLKELLDTNPHFVRCILPNTTKQSYLTDASLIKRQLQCNGVLEGIRIANIGFPIRLEYATFFRRYRLLNGSASESKDSIMQMFDKFGISQDKSQFGNTKLFLKLEALSILDNLRNTQLSKLICRFQAHVRGFLTRKSLMLDRKRRSSAEVIQKNFRAFHKLKQDRWWTLFCKARPFFAVLAQQNLEQKLRNQIHSLEEKLMHAQTENARMMHDHREQMEELLAENDKLYDSLESNTNIVEELTEQALLDKAQIEDLQLDRTKQIQLTQSVEEKLLPLEAKFSEVVSLKNSLEQQLKDEKQASHEYLGKLEAAHQQVAELEEKRARDSILQKSCESDRESFTQKSLAHKMELNQLVDTVKQLKSDNAMLQEQVSISKSEISANITMYQMLESANEKLKCKVREMEQTVIETRNESSKELEVAYQQLEMEKRSLLEQLHASEKKFHKSLQETQTASEEEILQLHDEKEQLQTRLRELNDKNSFLDNQLRLSKDRTLSLENRLNETSGKLKQTESKLISAQRSEKDLQALLQTLSSIENERNTLIKDSEVLRNECANLKLNLRKTQQKLDANESRNQELLANLKAATKSNYHEVSRSQKLETKVEETHNLYLQTLAELEETKRQLGSSLSDIEDARAEINRVSAYARDTENQIANFHEELCHLKEIKLPLLERENDSFKIRLTEKEDLLKESYSDLSKKTATISTMENRIIVLQEQQKELKSDHEMELQEWKSKIESQETIFERKLAEFEAERLKCFDKQQSILSELNESKKEIIQLKNTQADSDLIKRQLECSLYDVKLQLAQNIAQLKDVNERNKSLTHQNEEVKKKYLKCKESLLEAEKRFSLQSAERDGIMAEISELRASEQAYKATCAKQTEQINKLDQTILMKNSELLGAQRELRTAQRDLESQERALRLQFDSEKATLKKCIADLTAELDMKKGESHKKNLDLYTIVSKLNLAQEKIQQMTASSEQTQMKLNQLSKEKLQLESMFEGLQNESRQIACELSAAASENQRLTQTCTALSEKLDASRNDESNLKAEIKQLNSHFHLMEADLVSGKQSLGTSQKQVAKLEARLADLVQCKHSLENQVDKLKMDYNGLLVNHQNLQNKLKRVSEEENESEHEITKLRQLLKESAAEQDAIRASYHREIVQLKTEINSMKIIVQELRDRNTISTSSENNLRNEIQSLKRELDFCSQEKSSVVTKSDSLETALKSKTDDNEKLRYENANLQSKIAKLDQQCLILCKELESLATSYENAIKSRR